MNKKYRMELTNKILQKIIYAICMTALGYNIYLFSIVHSKIPDNEFTNFILFVNFVIFALFSYNLLRSDNDETDKK